MSYKVSLNYKNFRIAVAICLLLAVTILSLSFYLGKKEFFLLLNNDFGTGADFFFQYFTWMGDGVLWIAWLIVILVIKHKHLLPLIISAFIFTTIFTQAFKYLILPNELRPSKAFADVTQVHTVKGVLVHATASFPSGHTATAFTFFLLFTLTVKRKDVLLLAFVTALLVAYSRIYLGQHFPLDVGAGIVVGIFSVCLAVLVQRWFIGHR